VLGTVPAGWGQAGAGTISFLFDSLMVGGSLLAFLNLMLEFYM
jgi:hypothetical protein